MSRFSDEAFVLGVQDLQERDRIVDLFSRHYGRRRGVARGSRTRHSRFGGQLQLLAKVKVDWWEREGKDLGRLESIELIRPARWIDRGLEEMLLAFYFAEHVAIFAPEAEANDDLYRLLDAVMMALDAGCDRELAAAYLEHWILRLAGISPSWRECSGCGVALAEAAWLTLDLDGLVCSSCRDGRQAGPPLDARALAAIHEISRRPLAALAGSPPEPAAITAVREVSAAIRRGFLHQELRSFTVMAQTLATTPHTPRVPRQD